MDRRANPGHTRRRSGGAGDISIPTTSTVKRTQKVAAKAAAARLARVMATQTADEDEDDDDDALLPSRNGVDFGARYNAAPPRPIPGANGVAVPLKTNRSPSPSLARKHVERTPSFRSTSTGRPSSISTYTSTLPPPSRASLMTPAPIVPLGLVDGKDEKRFSTDVFKGSKESGNNREASILRDEVDKLQEENESILYELHAADQKCAEAEARARELEKQVADLGEEASLEARLLSRKEAALRQREAALKAATQNTGGRDEELSCLQLELNSLKNEAETHANKLQEVETESKALCAMTKRMILTQEEMEEVVLKRCWLARYWGLAIQYGVYPDIAMSKHEHWASLAPLPFEIVISAGQKAKDDSWLLGSDGLGRSARDLSEVTGEGNIESMLSVEKGLRELASLKVEDAVVVAISQSSRPNFVERFDSDPKTPGDPMLLEAFELNKEELEDILFKQSWLTYFWRRAVFHGMEEDIAEERLQFWIGCTGRKPSWHDAVNVERGLMELKKLGIEQQLWEVSRKEFDQTSSAANVKSERAETES